MLKEVRFLGLQSVPVLFYQSYISPGHVSLRQGLLKLQSKPQIEARREQHVAPTPLLVEGREVKWEGVEL